VTHALLPDFGKNWRIIWQKIIKLLKADPGVLPPQDLGLWWKCNSASEAVLSHGRYDEEREGCRWIVA